jgi:hypothetical protein
VVRRSWKISYVTIAAASNTRGEKTKPYEPPPGPAPQIRGEFEVGEKALPIVPSVRGIVGRTT